MSFFSSNRLKYDGKGAPNELEEDDRALGALGIKEEMKIDAVVFVTVADHDLGD